MISKLQKRLYDTLELSIGTVASRTIDGALISLIMLNVAAVMLGTVQSFALRHGTFLRLFETISIIVFTVEYAARMWICVLHDGYHHPVIGRIKYFFSPLALIDLIAIAPFYLPMLIPINLVFVRALRLIRLLRLLKMGRYSDSIRGMGSVVKAKKEELTVALTMSIILLLVASSFMYFIENGAQPDSFSSIPAAMWWAVTTMTTVGYGDIYPITPAGKVLGGFIAVLGIGLFVLPAGILAAGYAEQIQRKREHSVQCPRCGYRLKE
jgi:voltage-gated potassium channel